jgi:hypothetical protein
MTSDASTATTPTGPEAERPVSRRGHHVLDEIIGRLTDALNTTGQITQSYRDEVERELLRLAAAKATRCLGRPTRVFERPGSFHLLVTDWGSSLPRSSFDGAGHRVRDR